MDLLRESRYIISSFIIVIVCWLGWLCGFVFGQVGEAFTSAVNFPDVALTSLANLAAFCKIILRGKNWYEDRAKGMEGTLTKVKERNINGLKVSTTCGESIQKCSVVMLSFDYPHPWGARKYMDSISKASDVHSIILRCRPLQCGAFTEDFRNCSCTENRDGRCGCIVFNTVKDITMMLARQLPGTLKRLPDSHCLIPSVWCLSKGCHGCNQGLLHAENDTLKEGDPHLESPAAVCEILDQLKSIPKVFSCICIPVRPFNEDKWTNELIRVFEPQKREFRGVVFREGGTNASSALENYKNGNGECDADETYSLASLAIVPFLLEPLINFVLTFWFKVDGFSSTFLARQALSSHISSRFLASQGQTFPVEDLTRARVKSNANNTNVCQVLFFRPISQINKLHFLWYYPAGICCIGWMVLVALEGGADKWYHIQSMAPSEGRIIVIMVAISIAVAMDGFDLKLYLQTRKLVSFRRFRPRIIFWLCGIIGLQLLYIVVCIAIGRVVGIKAFSRWIYSALQFLVIVKWYSSNVIINSCQGASSQDSPKHGKPIWWYRSCGHYMAASAVLLNGTLAGVRAQWKFS